MSGTVEQGRPRCFPMTLIIDCCTPHSESVTDFLTNLRLSDLYDLPGEYVPMNPEIFSAMRAGNINYLEKMRSYGTPMACLKNDKGDSILHLAAALGHLELVESIISECPSLLLETNWKDQIPLHAAARAGHSAVVGTLVASISYFSANMSEGERERFSVYVLKDRDGDTPLHAALKGRHLETTLCLVDTNKLVSFRENNDGISPLYMAVEAGGLALVKAMLNGVGNNVQGQVSYLASQLEGRKWLVHAAMKAKNTDILDVILNKDPRLVNERDEEGRTCLSVGASVGFYKGVCRLLDRSTSSVFECNDDGSFPIHVAVENGHVDVAKEILKRCPDSIELLNKLGQNILHIASKNGNVIPLLLKYIKSLNKKKKHLIEQQDEDGNTPLHLATINWRPRTVRDLTKFSLNATKIKNIENKDGLRPLDIAESKLQPYYVFRERLTLMVLLSTYKPSGAAWLPTSGMTLRSISGNLKDSGYKYKDCVNILLLVATLVATVTFAAGIALPGGFNSSPPNLGKAILVNNLNFSLFVLYDTVAMHSSLVAIVALIWAQMGDPELVDRAFQLALPSLSLALIFMSAAFYHGLLATTSYNIFLSIPNTIIYSVFSAGNCFLLAPYVGPYIPGFRLFQWLMDIYLLILLRFVNEDDVEAYHSSGSGQTSV